MAEDLRERGIRIFYVALITGVCIYGGWWPVLIAFWLVPMVTTANWIGSLIELAEHYPYIETGPRVDILMTRNRLCCSLTNFFLGVHHEGYHLIHHLFPGMPSFNYPSVHKLLLQDKTYASLNASQGWRQILSEVTFKTSRDPVLEHKVLDFTIRDFTPASIDPRWWESKFPESGLAASPGKPCSFSAGSNDWG